MKYEKEILDFAVLECIISCFPLISTNDKCFHLMLLCHNMDQNVGRFIGKLIFLSISHTTYSSIQKDKQLINVKIYNLF